MFVFIRSLPRTDDGNVNVVNSHDNGNNTNDGISMDIAHGAYGNADYAKASVKTLTLISLMLLAIIIMMLATIALLPYVIKQSQRSRKSLS